MGQNCKIKHYNMYINKKSFSCFWMGEVNIVKLKNADEKCAQETERRKNARDKEK